MLITEPSSVGIMVCMIAFDETRIRLYIFFLIMLCVDALVYVFFLYGQPSFQMSVPEYSAFQNQGMGFIFYEVLCSGMIFFHLFWTSP